MSTLFDLEWAPIFKPFGLTILSLITADRCRDCGRIGGNGEHHCQGGKPGSGVFQLCDDCAALDGNWGLPVADRPRLEAEREARRDKFRRAS